MKKHTKNNLVLNTLGILLLCSWGNKEDENVGVTGDGKKPDVNFYGTIIDNTENVVGANYITIAGLYRQIPMYVIPQDVTNKNYNPTDNIARLDLAEISVLSLDEPEKIYTFSDRNYVKINILSVDEKTTHAYIIESGKKIYFDEINEAGSIERELAITALKEVHIKGYKERERKEEKQDMIIIKDNKKLSTQSLAQVENQKLSLDEIRMMAHASGTVIAPHLLPAVKNIIV